MTEIIEVEGVKYRKVNRKAKAGEKVIITNVDEDSGWYRKKLGEVFEVINPNNYSFSSVEYAVYVDFEPSRGSLAFISDKNYVVLEPIQPSEPSPSVTDILANLALRVSELERHNREQAYEINELYKEVSR